MSIFFHRKNKDLDEAELERLQQNRVEAYKKTAPVKVVLIASLVVVAVIAIMALGDHNRQLQNRSQLEAAVEAMQKKPAVWQGSNVTKEENTVEAEPDPFANYRSPIDFASLKEENEEVIGWLSIPGTDIEYPILQSKGDNTFYLNHNIEGEEDRNGSLYTEVTYNRDDFSDPVTAIYGHNMASGAMFGDLQEIFSQGFEGHDRAIVYLPDSQKEYKIIAALPIGAGHLLYGKNMRDSRTYMEFADGLINGSSDMALIADDARIEEGQCILVLSTCMGQPDKRYIVAGIEQQYEPDDADGSRVTKAREDSSSRENENGSADDNKTDYSNESDDDNESDEGRKNTDDSKIAAENENSSGKKITGTGKTVVRKDNVVTYRQSDTEVRKTAERSSNAKNGRTADNGGIALGSGSYVSPKTGYME